MTLTLNLFGAFREFERSGRIELELPDTATVADLRQAFDAHARAHWSGYQPALLKVSAFASESTVLRDNETLPAGGELAVLPPVSGG
jgi:sulfur-carrier protein